jgi:hypothetical protein
MEIKRECCLKYNYLHIFICKINLLDNNYIIIKSVIISSETKRPFFESV